MNERRLEVVPIKDIHIEDGVHELLSSPNMRPYIQLAKAVEEQVDIQSHFDTISRLPLEKRYLWRVASALKWGFADLDSVSVTKDRDTLSPENLAKVMELLEMRPIQFCIFLKALVGPDEMKRIMLNAIAFANQSG
jgi:hypothetical protein